MLLNYMGIFLQLFKKKNTVCNFEYKNAQEYIIVECLLFFLQTFVKLLDEIINILDTSDECLPGIVCLFCKYTAIKCPEGV